MNSIHRETQYQDYYQILSSLVSLKSSSNSSRCIKAYERVISSFMSYVNTGDDYHLDFIIYELEDDQSVILPQKLNGHISSYMESLIQTDYDLDNL
jgi:hypothetical protein